MSNRIVTVLGSGAWGAAFGYAIADTCDVVFWDRRTDVALSVAASAPAGTLVRAEADFNTAVVSAGLVIIAVSSVAFTDVLKRVVTLKRVPIVWLTKGFDQSTYQPLCTVATRVLGKSGQYAVLSGPSFAAEVANHQPTALALSANHRQDGIWMQQWLHREHLRLYWEDDMIGVCVGGATKNIIAIAAGISDAMGLGENARAALMTRGLSEMMVICEALGGDRRCLLGLAGMGDLSLTCSSDLSRNRRLGLAMGRSPESLYLPSTISRLVIGTCEGLAAITPILKCVDSFNLEVPITRAVAAVLQGRQSPRSAVLDLLKRPPRLI